MVAERGLWEGGLVFGRESGQMRRGGNLGGGKDERKQQG